jgi:hypothetical protein
MPNSMCILWILIYDLPARQFVSFALDLAVHIHSSNTCSLLIVITTLASMSERKNGVLNKFRYGEVAKFDIYLSVFVSVG